MQPNAQRQGNLAASANSGLDGGAHPMTTIDFRKADTEQWKNIVNNWMIAPDNTDT